LIQPAVSSRIPAGANAGTSGIAACEGSPSPGFVECNAIDEWSPQVCDTATTEAPLPQQQTKVQQRLRNQIQSITLDNEATAKQLPEAAKIIKKGKKRLEHAVEAIMKADFITGKTTHLFADSIQLFSKVLGNTYHRVRVWRRALVFSCSIID